MRATEFASREHGRKICRFVSPLDDGNYRKKKRELAILRVIAQHGNNTKQ